jgi:hypothetical protein
VIGSERLDPICPAGALINFSKRWLRQVGQAGSSPPRRKISQSPPQSGQWYSKIGMVISSGLRPPAIV